MFFFNPLQAVWIPDKTLFQVFDIHRGYFMAARGYEFYLQVLKVSLTSERSERDTGEIPT